jgi:predicted alpha-1,6-mannanase (GH76 family)
LELFDELQRSFFDRRTGLYRARGHMARPFAPLWPFANAWSATCFLAALDERSGAAASSLLPSRIPAVLRYLSPAHREETGGALGFVSTVYRPRWRPVAHRHWQKATTYNDDNEWIALALLQQFNLTGERHCVALAARIFEYVTADWDREPKWSHPGGIRWANVPRGRGRHACSNGPAAAVGAALFLVTAQREQRDWAVRIYDWTRARLQREDGLYLDLIRPDGAVEGPIWSYNQGSMIGAGVLLHRATGDEAYLHDAIGTASAALERYADPETLLREPATFAAIFLRNLLLLDTDSPNERYRSFADAYSTAYWEGARDPSSGRSPGRSGVNGIAPLVAIEALLAGSRPLP